MQAIGVSAKLYGEVGDHGPRRLAGRLHIRARRRMTDPRAPSPHLGDHPAAGRTVVPVPPRLSAPTPDDSG